MPAEGGTSPGTGLALAPSADAVVPQRTLTVIRALGQAREMHAHHRPLRKRLITAAILQIR